MSWSEDAVYSAKYSKASKLLLHEIIGAQIATANRSAPLKLYTQEVARLR